MCKTQFSKIQCIVPPYINKKILDTDDKELFKVAVNNKFRNNRIRNDRAFFSQISSAELGILSATSNRAKISKIANIEVYNCKRKAATTGAKLLWKTGALKLPTDSDAKNVIAGGTATWNFYNELFGRNSINNLGLTLKQYIHYDKKFDNAFWDGKQMIYGDGDGKIFGSFTTDVDVIGHELTHGVTQYEANLEYHLQSGAINESLSDVFGILIKQRLQNEDVKKSNWLIGENILLGKKYALRSMKAPGKGYVNHPELGTDPQPATMAEFVKLPDNYDGDWGGVHYNSGICNYAFFVAAFNIGGYAWEKAGRIWYASLTDKSLKPNASFKDFKKLTLIKADGMFGKGSLEYKAVKAGWDTAKVK